MRRQLGVLVTGLLVSSAAASAQPTDVALSAGYWGLRAHEPHELAYELELRPGVRWWWVRPTAGFLQSSEGTGYLFGGVILEIPLPWGMSVSPGFAPGIRTMNGARNLGSPLLFRSSIELGFPMFPGLRGIVGFAHISNGKLAAPNPGIELLLFGFEIALE